MDLSEPFKTQAMNELREDETRKVQALEQFRDWITKQDHIHNPRTGLWLSFTTSQIIVATFTFRRRQLFASISKSEKICKC
jgi:hypothetical protein